MKHCRQYRGDRDTNEILRLQMRVNKIRDEPDQDARQNAHGGVIADIVRRSELQKQTGRTNRLDKGEEPEHEPDEHPDTRPGRNGADDSRYMQNRRVHKDKRHESVPRDTEENGDGRQKTGHRKLTNIQKRVCRYMIDIFHEKSLRSYSPCEI